MITPKDIGKRCIIYVTHEYMDDRPPTKRWENWNLIIDAVYDGKVRAKGYGYATGKEVTIKIDLVRAIDE